MTASECPARVCLAPVTSFGIPLTCSLGGLKNPSGMYWHKRWMAPFPACPLPQPHPTPGWKPCSCILPSCRLFCLLAGLPCQPNPHLCQPLPTACLQGGLAEPLSQPYVNSARTCSCSPEATAAAWLDSLVLEASRVNTDGSAPWHTSGTFRGDRASK